MTGFKVILEIDPPYLVTLVTPLAHTVILYLHTQLIQIQLPPPLTSALILYLHTQSAS